MQGNEVFKVAVNTLGSIVDETLRSNSMSSNEIDWLVPHQANTRIISAMAKKLDMYVQRVIYLKNVVANRELLDVQRKAPAHPVIEKKCVCDANIL